MTSFRTALLFTLTLPCCASPGSSTPSSRGPTSPPSSPEYANTDDNKTTDLIIRAETSLRTHDAQGAKRAAEAALAKDPHNTKALYYDGVALDALGDTPGAEKRYREAMRLAPNFTDAAVNLSSLLIEQNRASEAVRLLQPLATQSSHDTLLQTNLAFALGATGDHAAAANAYAKALRTTNPQPEVRLGYAGELLALGKQEEAAIVLKEGLGSISSNRDQLAAFARALAQAGDFSDAIASLDNAIAIKASADLLTYRALFRRSTHDLANARADLEAATRADEQFAPAYLYLGEVLEGLKRPTEAQKAYEITVKLAPETPLGKRARAHLDAMRNSR